MPESVTVTFRSGASLGRPARLPLAELGVFLDKLGPTRVRIEVVGSRRRGTLALLTVDFPDMPAHAAAVAAPAPYFRETIARLEGELDYDASWGKAGWYTSSEPWHFLEPAASPARLASGKPVGFVFEPLRIANAVYDLASLNDIDVFLGVALTRAAPDAESVRHLVPALAELDGNSAQVRLADALSHAIGLAKSGGWRARECVGLPESASAFRTIVEATVNEEFRAAAPFLPADFLDLYWEDAPFGGEAPQGPAEIVSSLRPPGYLADVFTRLFAAGALSAAPGGVAGQPVLSGGERPGSAGPRTPFKGPYAFISYAHKNRDFAQGVIGRFGQHGISTWHDGGISPGAVWDETLEERVRNCAAMIACVSDDYQASKYCRREIKFADLLKKPIVPLADGPWAWGEGLQLMFQEYQIVDLRNAVGWENALGSLAQRAPELLLGRNGGVVLR